MRAKTRKIKFDSSLVLLIVLFIVTMLFLVVLFYSRWMPWVDIIFFKDNIKKSLGKDIKIEAILTPDFNINRVPFLIRKHPRLNKPDRTSGVSSSYYYYDYLLVKDNKIINLRVYSINRYVCYLEIVYHKSQEGFAIEVKRLLSKTFEGIEIKLILQSGD